MSVYLTTGQAGSALGCTGPTVRKLLATGAVPGALATGRMIVPSGAVEVLQEREHPDLATLGRPEIAVLRTGGPERTEGDPARAWTGFHVTHSEKDLLAALSGWWRCDPARVAAAGVMPVTVAGFVVAVLTGLDEWTADGGSGTSLRYHFTSARLAGYLTDLTTPVNRITTAPAGTDDRRLADLLLGTRLDSRSSGPIAYVRTCPITATTTAEGE